MRILVTGGAGFIGSHVTDTYITAGHEVFVVDDGSKDNSVALVRQFIATHSDINVILRINNTDVTNVKSFNETLAKVDSSKSVALLVRDENGTRFVPVRPDE